MNKAKLKSYAPEARRDFIQMIRQRADLLGLTKREIAPATLEGEISVIEGRAYKNKNYAALHKKLADKIRIEGAEQLIERVAYSWFNRFAALRFMEINNFLIHGFRVLSSRDEGKTEPEILTHAAEVDLPGLEAKPLENSYRLLGINNAGKPYFFWSEKPAQYAAYLGPSEPFGVWGSIIKEICKNNMKDYNKTFIADYETALELEKLGAVKPCGKCNRDEKKRYDADPNLQVNRKVEIE